MRIDYSEPKKAYVTHQGSSRPRKEPSGLFSISLAVCCIITFIAGFGTGWFFSQKAAKKSFLAATTQNSLENAPKPEPQPVKPQPAQPAPAPQPQPDPAAAQTPQADSARPAPEQPLSFYKALPSGQKGNVLGSGINLKDDKAKVPLQAAIPSNLLKPPANDPSRPAAVADKPAASDKPAAKSSDNNGFTVQVASFPLRSEAETLKSKLSAKGYNVFIVESHQGDKGTWYRVRVGRKLEQEAAKELSGKLGKGALVIPDKD